MVTIPPMSPTQPLARVDSRQSASVSFPAPESPVRQRVTARPDARVQQAFGPGRAALAAPVQIAGGPTVGMTSIPVQPSKVQAPPLRDETLARERLLDWLSVKIHNRIVLLAAEAGYGKTTLLADFSRRTRVRMLWYRLDLSDRDPMVFVHHLVGAVRVRLPEGCSAAFSLLAEVGPTGPALDVIVDAFVRGLSDLPNDATAFVFDDYHVVEDSPDIRPIVREILSRSPERLTLVFSSRKQPQIPIARLRAQGEVAELRTADLRFDESETERLFRDIYAMPLEAGIASELAKRTEGWAASLQLVQSAIRGRSTTEIRSFIRSLSGAEGDLYDYLAEEVVGDLSEELQLFLMRTAVLETIDPEFGAVAAGLRPDDVRSLIEDAERAGLVSRRGSVGRHVVRAHPLVRDFLLARLRRAVGPEGVAAIHRRVAVAAEPLDWALSGRHFRAAGDARDVRRVLHGSIDSILSSGAYSTAAALLEGDVEPPDGVTLVLGAREAMQRGDATAAVALATRATEAAPGASFAAITSMSAHFSVGDIGAALRESRVLAGPENEESDRALGRAIRLLLEGSVDLELAPIRAALEELIRWAEGPTRAHYRGVSLLNLAYLLRATHNAKESLDAAETAIELLESTSKGIELVSARLIRSWALADLGRLADARSELELARTTAPSSSRLEVAYETAGVEATYGSSSLARQAIERFRERIDPSTDQGEQAHLALTLVELRDGNLERAASLIAAFRWRTPRTALAFEALRQFALATLLVRQASDGAVAAVEAGLALTRKQGSESLGRSFRLLEAVLAGGNELNRVLREIGGDPSVISMCAESIVARVDDLDDEALGRIAAEAVLRPERWRRVIRDATERGAIRGRLKAAAILEQIGTRDDIACLRALARDIRPRSSAPDFARSLARRLATRVYIEDLGRVRIVVGEDRIEGTALRRKVLALLCLLLTRPRFAATREDVIESLWPDFDPAVALNSLNQTVYFLRRVFESDYNEALSPGYLDQDTETVWLDAELIDSRSAQCRRLLREIAPIPSPDQVWSLVRLYTDRFALEFAYEDWASEYRGALHAAYLRIVESAIKVDLDIGAFDRGISIAERALEIEPESDELQASLIRLYRLAGVHGAASERYTRYQAALGDLGLDAPRMADL